MFRTFITIVQIFCHEDKLEMVEPSSFHSTTLASTTFPLSVGFIA